MAICVHWLETPMDAKLAHGAEAQWLLQQAQELRAIFGTSLVTARAAFPKILG